MSDGPVTRLATPNLCPAPTPPAAKRLVRDASLPVLIVEDDRDVRAALCDLLMRWGVRFEAVATAADALARLDGGARYGLILSDHRLARNTTGLQLIETVLRRASGPVPAVVLVTGDLDPQLIGATTAMGVPLLTKPLKPADLRALLGLPPG